MAKATQNTTRKKTTVTIKPKETQQKEGVCPTCGQKIRK